MHYPLRVSLIATVLFPFVASAASMTATQQGVIASSAPKGAQRVLFLEMVLEADCSGDVKVSSIVVRHRGLGEVADIARVYITDGEARLDRAKTLDALDRTATLRFTPPLVIERCQAKRLQVRGDFSAEASTAGEHGLLIESIEADAPVLLKSTSATTVTTRPVSAGTVRASFLKLTRALQYGKNRTLARIRLEADNVSNHDVLSITFKNDGKAMDDDLQHLRLENRKGEVLTDTVASLSGASVTLTFTPALRVYRNNLLLLELKGDATAAKQKTVRFIIEEPSDIEARPAAR